MKNIAFIATKRHYEVVEAQILNDVSYILYNKCPTLSTLVIEKRSNILIVNSRTLMTIISIFYYLRKFFSPTRFQIILPDHIMEFYCLTFVRYLLIEDGVRNIVDTIPKDRRILLNYLLRRSNGRNSYCAGYLASGKIPVPKHLLALLRENRQNKTVPAKIRPVNKNIIITQPFYEDGILSFDEAMCLIKLMVKLTEDGNTTVIKLHPRMYSNYERYYSELGKEVIKSDNQSNYYLHAVTLFSTYIFEVHALRKTAIGTDVSEALMHKFGNVNLEV